MDKGPLDSRRGIDDRRHARRLSGEGAVHQYDADNRINSVDICKRRNRSEDRSHGDRRQFAGWDGQDERESKDHYEQGPETGNDPAQSAGDQEGDHSHAEAAGNVGTEKAVGPQDE